MVRWIAQLCLPEITSAHPAKRHITNNMLVASQSIEVLSVQMHYCALDDDNHHHILYLMFSTDMKCLAHEMHLSSGFVHWHWKKICVGMLPQKVFGLGIFVGPTRSAEFLC